MIGLIIGIIIFIIIAGVLFYVLRKVLKVVLILIAILILAFAVCGYLVYKDTKDMAKNFETSPNLILLESNGGIIAGIQTVPQQEEPNPLGSAEISSYSDYYKVNELDKIKGDNYKLIIFNEKAFDSVQQITLDNRTYTKDFVFVLINSDTPVDDYIDNSLIMDGVPQEQRADVRQQMKSDFGFTDTEFKGMLVASLFGNRIDNEGSLFIFKQYKAGNAAVYKETAVFQLVKLIPTSFVEGIIKNTASAVKETVEEKIKQVS